MNKIKNKNILVGLALLLSFFLAFFSTTDFIKAPFVLNSNVKQQHFNETGIFTVTPFDAAKFYSEDPSVSYWIDVRDTADYSKSHLKIAINQTLVQLEGTQWKPADVILIYGKDTRQAQEAAAYLRQVKNARAFAIKGGFPEVKKYLIDPVGISITSRLSDSDLSRLLTLRNKISGESVPIEDLMKSLKSSKKKAIREGC